MGDETTYSQELKIRADFGSDDDRLITLKNPRNDLTADDVRNAFSDVTVTQVIVGDKNNDLFTGLSTAYIETKTDRKLDLNS